MSFYESKKKKIDILYCKNIIFAVEVTLTLSFIFLVIEPLDICINAKESTFSIKYYGLPNTFLLKFENGKCKITRFNSPKSKNILSVMHVIDFLSVCDSCLDFLEIEFFVFIFLNNYFISAEYGII